MPSLIQDMALYNTSSSSTSIRSRCVLLGYGKDSFLRQPYEPLKQEILLLYDNDC